MSCEVERLNGTPISTLANSVAIADILATQVESVTGNIVDNTDPQNPIVNETITVLAYANNVLTYTNEAGVVTSVDLTPYLDDTNLARLVSGVVDVNGIATFTRDDGTTFTVDMSSFLDNTNIDAQEGSNIVIDKTDPMAPIFSSVNDDLNEVDFTATDGQVDFVVTGQVFTEARVYEGGIKVKADAFTIANDGTDTTVSITAGVALNTWVLVDINK